jgi:multicomponent Na+:H+ antiporter subunit G
MTIAVDVLLALGVLAAWFATAAFIRLRTPLERIHAVTFLNVVAGLLIVAAAILTDGLTSRSLKCALLLVAVLAIGALLSQVTGRALHVRQGERR